MSDGDAFAPFAPLGPSALPAAADWKVLVYDFSSRDVIAPLLRVADLRARGVTLHLGIAAARQPIPDVPAVYFVAPTRENVLRIAADAAAGLYRELWVNFSSSVPRDMLELLAETVAANSAKPATAGAIVRVYDMYAEFLSLEHDLFSLNVPGTFTSLNARSADDKSVTAVVERVVNRLMCVLVTLRAVPIIRAQRGGPAELVAQMLEDRVREALVAGNSGIFASSRDGDVGSDEDDDRNVTSHSGGMNSSSFGMSYNSNVGGGSGGHSSRGMPSRPLLVLMDRYIDLPVMLHHTWTYQALTHDSLSLNLNRVTIPVPDADAAVALLQSQKSRVYDLDKADSFWAINAGLPFPMVAEAVETALQDYKTEVAAINRSATAAGTDPVVQHQLNDGDNPGVDLAAAISSLPLLTKKKHMIDLHTNIATALLDCIKARGLDGYYQVEEELLARPQSFDVERILALLQDARGTPTDKLRLFLIFFLCIDGLSEKSISQCSTALDQSGCQDMRAFAYLKSIKAFTSTMENIGSLGTPGDEPSSSTSAINSGYAAVLGTLSQVASNVHNLILSADKALPTARVVSTLMDQKGDAAILEGYTLHDPKGPRGGGATPESRRTFTEAIVCVVGPGNYIEYQNCKDHICSIVNTEGSTTRMVPNGKTVIYGATELCNGTDFLEQLQTLGGSKVVQPPSPSGDDSAGLNS
jgi:sec1 family domain-containing protein 1